MSYENSSETLSGILQENIDAVAQEWLSLKLKEIVEELSTRKLYLTYTLCSSKIEKSNIDYSKCETNEVVSYLKVKQANTLEISRIYLLIKVLEANNDFFADKVKKLIQVADTLELETFLKYLMLLPNSKAFIFEAVEALRTNISTVFDAIAMDNPYPSLYFNDQQWNQMYLKAAFMQRDLSRIVAIDRKGNKDLTRIISDYAHERWAASRTIDPEFWRPVSNFVQGVLVDDMKRLFQSDDLQENKAAALVCYNSDKAEAQDLLNKYPKHKDQLERKTLTWDSFKN